ncbi:hypothetical protein [Nitrosopumilus sp.]|uniref:hypothetical protein n=1 Tax=Nitrosopumilus sp. TaxID=2024843 RepID=UPI003D13A1BE
MGAESILKIAGIIISLIGALLLILGISSFISITSTTEPNVAQVAMGAIMLAVGFFLTKISD